MDSTQVFGKRKFNNRRPKKVLLRKKRIVQREIRRLREEFGHFAIGGKFLHSRKKRLLILKDLKERIKFFQKD